MILLRIIPTLFTSSISPLLFYYRHMKVHRESTKDRIGTLPGRNQADILEKQQNPNSLKKGMFKDAGDF